MQRSKLERTAWNGSLPDWPYLHQRRRSEIVKLLFLLRKNRVGTGGTVLCRALLFRSLHQLITPPFCGFLRF
jgi:hypothetical protein